MEQYMWIVWLVAFALAIIIEAATTELVSIFFAIGSLVSLIISFIPGVNWWIEIIVFVVVSGASLLGLRPLMTKFLNREKRSTNVDELIGKKGTMAKCYNENSFGEIKVNGVVWTAVNEDEGEEIKEGEKVTIVAINGNKLIVRKDK